MDMQITTPLSTTKHLHLTDTDMLAGPIDPRLSGANNLTRWEGWWDGGIQALGRTDG